MMGLEGTRNLGVRALQTQSQGLAVTGQNLANVNNPAYTRQRLLVQTSSGLPSAIGSQGTGVNAVGIQRIHNALLDRQIQNESSVSGFWSTQQRALLSAQTHLGEALDSSAQGTSGSAGGLGAQSSLASDLDGLFNEFQSLAASPASLSQRSVLLSRAQNLAAQFNQTGQRLGELNDALNSSVVADVGEVNKLLQGVAQLNDQIRRAEAGTPGSANDLRDLRQQKIETLAGYTNVDVNEDADGQVNLAVDGTLLVSGRQVMETIEAYDSGGRQQMVRTSTGTALALTGGSIQGTIDARDGALATLRGGLDTLASTLATEVNAVHRGGYNLNGGSGADFFVGTSATTLRVNADLVRDPALLQASGTAGAVGDNQKLLQLAALADRPLAGLGGQTFSANYARRVSALGESLATANGQVEDQDLIAGMLQRQRSSVSGVSVDEEMTNLVQYQKAFQASARIVSTVDEMLTEVINLKR